MNQIYPELRFEIVKNFDTQADFAMEAGMDETVVSRILHGRRKLTTEQAQQWLKLLKCDPDILDPVTRNEDA